MNVVLCRLHVCFWGRWLWGGLLVVWLVGCGANEPTAVSPTPFPLFPPPDLTGDPARGQTLYERRVLGEGAPGCVTCHSLAPGVVLVGPSHYGLADRVAQMVPEQDAALYLWQSIVDPSAHVTQGFDAREMYAQYATQLTAQEVADLVAYMLTLNE